MKKVKFLVMLLSLLCIFSVLPFTASAAKTSEVVYENDFESGKLDDTFVVEYGTLSVKKEGDEQFLRCNHENNRLQFAYGPEEQKDVDISFKIRATTIGNNTNSTVSAIFRSPHIPAWDTVGYQLQLKTFQASLIYADRFADGNSLTPMVDSDQFGISIGLWNNVKISTRGKKMIVYINGNLLLETSDDRYGEYGGFGFTGLQSSFDIDDIVITRYYGKKMPEPTANERPLWAGDINENETLDAPDTGVLRIDLTILGQEKKPTSNAVTYVNNAEFNIYSLLALIITVLCAVGSAIGFIILFKKRKGGNA